VVARQLRSSAGTWVRMGGADVMLDPGPGTLVRCWSSRPKLDPAGLDAIVLTHHHLDHANDANVLVEAMTEGGHSRRGLLLASREAYEGDSPLCRYVRRFPQRVETLEEGSRHDVGMLTITAQAKLRHGVETYGLIFQDGLGKLGFVADTYYWDGLGERFIGCDLLVVNVVLYQDHGPGVTHLNPKSAARVIAEAHPARAVITHFGMHMLRQKPWEIAARMSEETGVAIEAASDGMVVDLSAGRQTAAPKQRDAVGEMD
jgi:phosphoribosyl 1,2-cyclic phosphodiesterase